MIIAVLSDTHNKTSTLRKKNAIPDADVYIFPGDMTSFGYDHELRNWRAEVQRLLDQGKQVVAIPGNHERGVEANYANALEIIDPRPDLGFHWLLDSGCEIDGVQFWGSPWQPYFGGWAYNLKLESELAEKWDMIPDGTDVVITHGPPAGILDVTSRNESVGSTSLLVRISDLKPQVHCFGHIHESYGRMTIGGTEYINAAICTKSYDPVNPVPVVSVQAR